jgi:hypothetical protein
MASFATHLDDYDDIALAEHDSSSSEDDDVREAKIQTEDDDDEEDDDSGTRTRELGAAAAGSSNNYIAAGGVANADSDDDSGDGDLPLATPYPWAQDDYELTLHHEPKKKTPVGTGMIYLKRLLKDESEGDKFEESTILSAPAKELLQSLLRQHTKTPKDEDDDDSSDSSESEDEEEDEEDDDDDDDEGRKQRCHLPGPRLWRTSVDHISTTGFLYSILKEIDSLHPQNVTTRHLIRACALTLPAGAPPGCMDAKEMMMCALHWLSSDWSSPDPSQLPSLPLLQATTTGATARDLEKCAYEKAGNWTMDSFPPNSLDELERFFLYSPSSSTQLEWMSRLRFCPRIVAKGKDETQILLKGNIPASMTGKKPKDQASSPGATAGTTERAKPGPKPGRKPGPGRGRKRKVPDMAESIAMEAASAAAAEPILQSDPQSMATPFVMATLVDDGM